MLRPEEATVSSGSRDSMLRLPGKRTRTPRLRAHGHLNCRRTSRLGTHSRSARLDSSSTRQKTVEAPAPARLSSPEPVWFLALDRTHEPSARGDSPRFTMVRGSALLACGGPGRPHGPWTARDPRRESQENTYDVLDLIAQCTDNPPNRRLQDRIILIPTASLHVEVSRAAKRPSQASRHRRRGVHRAAP